MQYRLAHQGNQFLEKIQASAFGRVEDGRQGRVGVGTPFRAKAA